MFITKIVVIVLPLGIDHAEMVEMASASRSLALAPGTYFATVHTRRYWLHSHRRESDATYNLDTVRYWGAGIGGVNGRPLEHGEWHAEVAKKTRCLLLFPRPCATCSLGCFSAPIRAYSQCSFFFGFQPQKGQKFAIGGVRYWGG